MLSSEIERLQYKLNNKNNEADDLKKKLAASE
jgi:predicted RNase H-like nuclease (RuvC/YqgF family)